MDVVSLRYDIKLDQNIVTSYFLIISLVLSVKIKKQFLGLNISIIFFYYFQKFFMCCILQPKKGSF